MKLLKKLFILLCTLVIFLSFVSCNNKKIDPISDTKLFMGTVVKITLYDSNDKKILTKAFNKVSEIENLVSINIKGTELDKINAAAGKEAVTVSPETFYIIEKALKYSELSNGTFDPTIGPLVKLWGIGTETAKVPTTEEINAVLPLINYKNVEIDNKKNTVFLKEEGMIIDLGSIAKGYTADAVAEVLINEGVKSAIIDLGGNIYVLGKKTSGEAFKVGIQNPDSSRGDIVGSISVTDKTVVTSGIYERYIEEDGVKYHHLLSPNTGYPFDNDIAGVSIITDKSIDADALSTVIFSKGIQEGLTLVETLDNIEAIFISKNKEIYLSSGIKNNFKLINTEFNIVE